MLSEEEIGNVAKGILKQTKEELMSKSKEQLEEYWFFDFNEGLDDIEWFSYKFYKALDLYGSFCREWEEEKNGSVCVVERARKNYLMPKIKKYLGKIESETIRRCEEKFKSLIYRIDVVNDYLSHNDIKGAKEHLEMVKKELEKSGR